MTEDEKSRVEDFAEAILHGDEQHRAWLLEAAEAFNTGEPLPEPKTTATQVRINELKDTLEEYGRHKESCIDDICNCGWQEIIGRELTREGEELGLYGED